MPCTARQVTQVSRVRNSRAMATGLDLQLSCGHWMYEGGDPPPEISKRLGTVRPCPIWPCYKPDKAMGRLDV